MIPSSVNGNSLSYHTLFLMFDRPPDGQAGETFALQVLQTDVHREQVLGGQDLRIELVPTFA